MSLPSPSCMKSLWKIDCNKQVEFLRISMTQFFFRLIIRCSIKDPGSCSKAKTIELPGFEHHREFKFVWRCVFWRDKSQGM